MLIVNDVDADDVRDLIPTDDSRISVCLDAPRMLIGPKRNYGCSLITTDLIAHFDDDDDSTPGRLNDQVGRLLETRAAVTGYRTLRYTDGERFWLYEGQPNFAGGNTLIYRREWWKSHPFPPCQIGEDSAFVEEAARNGKLVVSDGLDFILALIHPGNASPKITGCGGYKPVGPPTVSSPELQRQ